jgi:hypothetical protein
LGHAITVAGSGWVFVAIGGQLSGILVQ